MYGPLGGGPSLRGIFNENRFVTELDPDKASEQGGASAADPDFRWNEEQETLMVKPSLLPPPPPPKNYAYGPAAASNDKVPPPSPLPPPAQPPAPTAKPNCTPQAQQGPKVNVKTPPKASAWACKTLGICSDNKPVVLNPDNG
jgi:hypothetical protein